MLNPRQKSFSELTALLVDDNPGLCAAFERELHERGLKVVIAHNGQEALTRLRHFKVDLIISDLHMPVMDGLTLFEKVQKVYQEIPFLLMSVGLSQEMQERMQGLGLTNFCEKLLMDELFRWVDRQAHLKLQSAQV